MTNQSFPEPALDAREEKLLLDITKDYKAFVEPGMISRAVTAVGDGIGQVTPASVKDFFSGATESVSELDVWKKVMKTAARGFNQIAKQASRVTLSPNDAVVALCAQGYELNGYEYVCTVRSYHVEKCATNDWRDRVLAFTNGAVCGAPGLPGVPFNIAIGFFLYFRATQSIALWYGYDVRNDPRELEIAAEVTMRCLAPSMETQATTLGGYMSKMMAASSASALRQSLGKNTFEQMAKNGGIELLYVQIRALAHKSARTALEKAGKDGVEASVYRKMLEQLGRYMGKEAGRKAIPVLGAITGALFDSYYMDRVLYGANMMYHKRFLLEKEERIGILREESPQGGDEVVVEVG